MSLLKRKKAASNFSVTFANGEREEMEIDNYCFTRINKYLKLKRKIREIVEQKENHLKTMQNEWVNNFTTFFLGKFLDDASSKKEIENYWHTHMGKVDLTEDYKKDHRVFEIVILQMTFRTWLFLLRLRKLKRNELLSPKTYMGETQTKEQKDEIELRKRTAQKLIQNKKKLAAKFCRVMEDGKYKNIRVIICGETMMKDSPIFRFSKDRKSVETAEGTFELKRIYDVQLGLTSETKRVLRLPDDHCLHLKMTGNVILEIEAKTTEDASQLFTGFKVLRNCLLSMHSFTIKDGIPKRFVSKVIEDIIRDGQMLEIDDTKSINSDLQKKVEDDKSKISKRIQFENLPEIGKDKNPSDPLTVNSVKLALKSNDYETLKVDSDDDSED